MPESFEVRPEIPSPTCVCERVSAVTGTIDGEGVGGEALRVADEGVLLEVGEGDLLGAGEAVARGQDEVCAQRCDERRRRRKS